MANEVLVTRGLTKKFGKKVAVDNISMTLEKGDIYGLIGRNGAGKTTFMKLLLGFTNQTSGTFEILVENNVETARLKTGSIIETPAFYDKVSAYKNMVYRAKLIGLKNPKERIEKLLNMVGLSEVANQSVKEYSLGMRQKLGIATALLGSPDLLILDEPINGLDPVAIAEVRKILKQANKQGVTILISSHILGEMQKIATRYGFIVSGSLVSEISELEIEKKGIDLESYSLKVMGVSDDE